VRTPALDSLAAEGTRFARHYTQGTPCHPGRASLHTGMYAMNSHAVGNNTPIDARFTNWALELRKLGYDPTLVELTAGESVAHYVSISTERAQIHIRS
jgi:arylsulfatase A-like enzyme